MSTNTIAIKNNWEEITWGEYEQIEQIINTDIPSDYKSVHLVSVLTGRTVNDIELLPISTFTALVKHLDFLDTEPETHFHKFEYNINGREYDFKGKYNDITTAQYIDYRAYMQEEDRDIVKLMSVFLIPKGHDYNDGYDMEQVQRDINDMCWLDLRACAFFFRTQLAASILILKSSLHKTMKSSKAKKAEIKQVEESLNNLASYLLSAQFAHSPMQTLTL